jgi:FKBP-type peptidyl-prolyl cis-trans isomerase
MSCTKTSVTLSTEDLTIRQDSIILQYLRENKITNYQKHSTGFYYTITAANNSSKAELGDSLSVNYTGSILYGKVFDSNLNRTIYEPYNFRYLRDRSNFNAKPAPPLISFQDASALLAKGEKGKFFMPSRILYGSQGSGNPILGSNVVTVFEIEMLNIFKL